MQDRRFRRCLDPASP